MSSENHVEAAAMCNDDGQNLTAEKQEITSPGQLQDVTMDNSYALGYRSPSMSLPHGGHASPGQGRSVREFEEQMASLRNENFNLKLRLYFLEQKIPGYVSSANTSEGHESLLKQNVDLKVDIEVLKKDIQQKQSLLCEAAKAMELMEEQQKENEDKSRGIIEDLNQKIQYLEEENKHFERTAGQQSMDQLMGRSDLKGDVDILQKVRELEGQVKLYQEKTEELIHKQTELVDEIAVKDGQLKVQEETTKQLEFQIAELQEQLEEKAKETACLEKKFEDRTRKLTSEKDIEIMKLSTEIKSMNQAVEKLKADAERERANSEDRNKKLKEQQHLMEEMQNAKLKDDLQEYKSQLADRTCELKEVRELLDEKSSQCEKLRKAIEKLIADTKGLQSEIDRLKKSTGSQSISYIKEQDHGSTYETNTTALCEDRLSSTRLEIILAKKEAEIVALKEEVKKKTANLQTLINKELWEKNREIERLTKLVNGRASNSPVRELDPLQQSFSDSDYLQALEQNKRLQARVDSLIQKLGIANERNTEQTTQYLKMQIRDAREDAERAERWRKECADLCSVLTGRLEELAGFLDSLLKQKDVLGALGADRRKAMRKAVDRSLELSRSLNSMSLSFSGTSIGENSLELLGNLTNILDHTSDKENRTFNFNNDTLPAGSTLLIENLKAEVKALKKELDKKKLPESMKKERRTLPLRLDNQSESEAWSEPDRNVSLARIGLEESLGTKAGGKQKEDVDANTTSDSAADQSRKCKGKHHDKITQLEQIISQKENKILQVQCELVEADNRLKEETLRRLDISRELDNCRRTNALLETEINKSKDEANKCIETINELQVYRQRAEEARTVLDTLREERDQLNENICILELQIESLKDEQSLLKRQHQHEVDELREREHKMLNAIETELLRKYEEKLQQVENNHKEYLARDWVSRVIYEQTKRELEDIQRKLTEAQFTIEFLRENEAELNGQLIENEKVRRNLKLNLDEATLQSSRIVVERTKSVTEKLHLEAQLQELTVELETIKRERDEAKEENTILRNQMLVATVEIKKAVRQSSSGTEMSHSGSGYTSEDAHAGGNNRNERNVMQRLNNSSPDLGIESDAGRTSSTDQPGNDVKSHGPISRPKPELHPLNIVDEASPDASSTTRTNPIARTNVDLTNNNSNAVVVSQKSSTTGHDCAKVDQELAELRRKVIRQKRALENTWNSLRESNQRKEQIERDIRQQILKTQNVLKNVRTNIESEIVQPRKEMSSLQNNTQECDE